jgi:hypothetical protein
MKKSLFLILSISLVSCSFHTGNVSTGIIPDCPHTNVVQGTSSTNIVFGIGGLKKDALIAEAKKDLYARIDYDKNLKLSNFSVDFKNTYYPFVLNTKVTVSADVYSCAEPNADVNSEQFLQNYPLINGIRKGDRVYFERENAIMAGKVVEHYENDFIQVAYFDDGITKYLTIPHTKVFKSSSSTSNLTNFGYDVGDTVSVKIADYNLVEVKTCKIIAINASKAYVEYQLDNGKRQRKLVKKEILNK